MSKHAFLTVFFIIMIFPFCQSCKKGNSTIIHKPILSQFTLPELFQTGTIKGDSIIFNLPYGTNLSNIKVDYQLNDDANASIPRNTYINLSRSIDFVIKKGDYSEHYVLVAYIPSHPDTAVRGVWITNVGSPALSTEDNIRNTVDLVASLHLNAIYVVVFNKNQTLFPSTVLQNNVPEGTQTQIFGPGWDPLQILIDYAHLKGIKVIPWFEYGFISHYTGYPHPILDKHPEWVSIDKNGLPTVRNNFTWLNGFHPQVQQFMLDLILDAVKKYNIDGIQCDDHLPAMPINSGYDSLTLNTYLQQTGNPIPTSDTDPNWMKWRADQLSQFAKRIYDSVKAIKPNCLVCFAPGPLDWSLQNNLADWESWVKMGIVDILSPLLYRNENQGLSAYTSLLDKDISRIIKNYAFPRNRYSPGIMVKNGSYSPSDNYLSRVFLYNTYNQIYGASLWYYDGLINNMKVYKAFYPANAIFPNR
ncbi:MAG: family 10 glycosylhydrolase [Thermoflavifilum sp.]|nr:family 10 glycosylhydrolase [Thermoflavifilum sp.]